VVSTTDAHSSGSDGSDSLSSLAGLGTTNSTTSIATAADAGNASSLRKYHRSPVLSGISSVNRPRSDRAALSQQADPREPARTTVLSLTILTATTQLIRPQFVVAKWGTGTSFGATDTARTRLFCYPSPRSLLGFSAIGGYNGAD